MRTLLEDSKNSGKFNVAFQAAFQLGDAESCVEILTKAGRIAEAAIFAKTYIPSKMG